jgi:hypothetical protein
MHLLDKFIIIQFGKDDFLFIGHVITPWSRRRFSAPVTTPEWRHTKNRLWGKRDRIYLFRDNAGGI